MCQMSVVLEENDHTEPIMDGVTMLETTADGVRMSAFFEEPKLIPGVQVIRIDFLNGKVFLGKPIPMILEDKNG
ncbi:MAG: CooT family nickel-binding protein [Proteobacteria bacterium]|nr:CooT family nickel-binding protein [Pseudomonadota bacterium]MBU1688153.1 CooT family nickel-binding protein [Pseudomonadota bacterium]